MGIAPAISKGGGKEGKPFWFSSLSIRPSFPPCSGICSLRFAIRRCASRSQPSVGVLLFAFRWQLRYRTASGEAFQFGHADTGPQAAFALGRLTEDLERRGPLAINAAPLAVGLLHDLGNGAGPVEVEIRIEILLDETDDRFGVLARRCGRNPCACGSPLRFSTPPDRCRWCGGRGFGLLDQQLVQQSGDLVVDELAAVIGMKTENAERKLFQHAPAAVPATLRRSAARPPPSAIASLRPPR